MTPQMSGRTEALNREEESEVVVYLWMFFRRWPVIVAAILLTLTATLIYSRMTPPIYEAKSMVRIRKPTPVQVFDSLRPQLERESLDLKTAAQLITTYLTAQRALDLLQRPPLAKRMSRTTREYLRLISPHEILQVTKTTPLEPDLVSIAVRHPIPEVAAAFANGLAEAFVQRLNQETRAEASAERRFIENQLKAIEGQLRQLDITIAQVYRQLRTVDVSEETKSLIEALRTLTTDLQTAESELRSLQSSLAKMRQAVAQQSPVLSVEVLKEDPIITELQRQLAAAQVDRANLLARYTPDHPAVQEVDERIKTLMTTIRQRANRVVKGVETVPNTLYTALQQQLMELELRRFSTEARRQALLTLLQQVQKQMERLPEDRRKIGELTRRLQVLEQTYTNLLGRLQDAQIREASRLGNAVIADIATVPKSPVSPNLFRLLLFALVAGLVLGVGTAILLEKTQMTLETADELRRLLDAPVLGLIPKTRRELTQEQIVELMQSQRRTAEAIRTLRANLKFLSRKRPFRTLLVTSLTAEEGKTFLVTALGLAYAQDGYRVILVDADLRHPDIRRRLKLKEGAGLREVLEGTASLDEALQAGPIGNLWVLTAGTPPPSPVELLDSPAMSQVLNALKERADLVIIDSPPVLPVTDAVVLAPLMDGVLLVTTAQTPRPALLKAREQLELAEATLLGAVLNKITGKSVRGGYYYYGYYGYYYTYYGSPD